MSGRLLAWVAVLVGAALAHAQSLAFCGFQRPVNAATSFHPGGGRDGRPALIQGAELYEWDGGSWERPIPIAVRPGSFERYAFDPERREQLALVPSNGLVTWAWRSGAWTQEPLVAVPGLGLPCFHPGLGKLVLVGQYGPSLVRTSGQWSQGPLFPALGLQAVAPDLARGVVVATVSGQTLVWDANGWSRTPAPTPSGSAALKSLAWDPLSQRVLGISVFPGPVQAWSWDGTSWTLTPLPAGSQSALPMLGYDVVAGRVRAFDNVGCDDLVWDGASWTVAPRGVGLGPIGVDTQRGRWVQSSAFDTREWDGAHWTVLPSTVQPSVEPIFDFGRQQMLGVRPGAAGIESFAWNGSTWRPLTSPSVPPNRTRYGLVQATGFLGVVLFGGTDASGDRGDTWLWNGQWTELTSLLVQAPPAGAGTRVQQSDALRPGLLFARNELWEWTAAWRLIDNTLPAATTAGAVELDSGDLLVSAQLADFSPRLFRRTGTTWVMVGSTLAHSIVLDPQRRVPWLIEGDEQQVLTTLPAGEEEVGAGCGSPPPLLATPGRAVWANPDYRAVVRTDAAAPVLLAISPAAGSVPLGGGCTQWIAAPIDVRPALADASGRADVALPIPAIPSLRGASAWLQAATLTAGGPLGGIAVSGALRVTIGD